MSTAKILEADYLVVGTGAMGMAFTDVIVHESDATVVCVDRHDQPGGHWNDAYPFVRLHSASTYYGVNSRHLGEDSIDQTGLNRGYHEQASAAELCSYFDRVMRRRFLPTGRVQYLPSCEYRGDGRVVSLTSGVEHRVRARKIIDATFTDTAVPSRCAPKYAVEAGVRLIPPNSLPNAGHADRYVVIGAGKTGMDVILWLLTHDVAPESITWIMPRDSWLLDREHVEPREAFFKQRMGSFVRQTELIEAARSIDHLFQLLHEHGELLRIDDRVTPTRYRCATVSRAELAQLRRVTNIVRLGHVQRIEPREIVLEHGRVQTTPDVLHIDCSTSGIRSRPTVPVFNGNTITLQPIRTCQQCFSSALIAYLELTRETDTEKNRLAAPIPLPIRDVDWLTMYITNLRNQSLWSSTPDLRDWISRSRLDMDHGRTTPLTPAEAELVQRFRAGAGPAAAKLEAMLARERSDVSDATLATEPCL